jgi:hypothetical protein
MSITIDPEPELWLRERAKAEKEIEALAMEGLRSGEPIEPGPGYWEEKHRRLDERIGETRGR